MRSWVDGRSESLTGIKPKEKEEWKNKVKTKTKVKDKFTPRSSASSVEALGLPKEHERTTGRRLVCCHLALGCLRL